MKGDIEFITCAVGASCLFGVIYLLAITVAVKAGVVAVAFTFSFLGELLGFVACALLNANK